MEGEKREVVWHTCHYKSVRMLKVEFDFCIKVEGKWEGGGRERKRETLVFVFRANF